MSIKCIIVDDERLAQNVLEKYINTLPSLLLLQKCSTALEALSYLHEHPVDLMFLDINMPEMSGLDMIKTLEKAPKVILTTAYSEYALESYDYGIVDYLLKPIAFDRFLKAVNRVIASSHNDADTSKDKPEHETQDWIILKQDGILNKTPLEDILYIEAYGNYLNVYTREEKFMIREKLHEIEKKLPPKLFVRIHKSFIVSLNRISSVKGNRVMIGDIAIPIGDYYKAELDKRIKGS